LNINRNSVTLFSGPSNIVLTYSCPATENYPINVNYNCFRTRVNSSDIAIPTFGHAEKCVLQYFKPDML